MSERTFSEAEVRAIFEAAARRQSALRTDAQGLTLAELQKIAVETGLDPTLVTAAAAELHQPPAETWPLIDGPVELHLERVLPGDVSDAQWEQTVAELRRTFKVTGTAGQIGRVREWTVAATESPSGTAYRIEVRPEGAHTRLVLDQSLKSLATGMYAGAASLLAVAVLMVSLGGRIPPALIAAFSLAALLFFFGFRWGLGYIRRQQTERFERIADRLDLLLSKEAQSAPVAAPLPPSAARLDATLLDADAPDATSAARRDQTGTARVG